MAPAQINDPAQPQDEAARAWLRVQAVASGTALIVKTKSGETHQGLAKNATDTVLSLSTDNRDLDLKRDTIRGIYFVKRKSGAKTVLLWIGVGCAVGVGIGAAIASSDDDSIGANFAPASGAAIGIAAGTVIGLLRSGGTRQGAALYEAK